MPSSREVRDRRRAAILEILQGNQPVSQQKEIVEMLQAKGIAATQSSVSRDLAELGAVRVGDLWRLPGWSADSPFSKVVDYVVEVKPAGPYSTLIRTLPGAGAVVAQAIDASQWEDVVGTVAGPNSVLVLTEDAFDQKLLFLRLERYLEPEEDLGDFPEESPEEDFLDLHEELEDEMEP
jgi:transcriptional regulator of arginine metabolism